MAFISKISVTGYKSLRNVRIELTDLSILVGPNGAGKSNLIDALRFVRDIISSNLDHALRVRGGLNSVLHRSSEDISSFCISMILELDHGVSAKFGFTVGQNSKNRPILLKEACWVNDHKKRESYYRIENGKLLEASFVIRPPVPEDRPYLNLVSGFDEFTYLYDELLHMGFYNLGPEAIRSLQSPSPEVMLNSNGSNVASVFGGMSLETRQRIVTYLQRFVSGLVDVRKVDLDRMETLDFWQIVDDERKFLGNPQPVRFRGSEMSDGSLRAFAVLVACFQHLGSFEVHVPFIAIEEPELALHPAASGILLAAFQEVSLGRQVLLSTHSPDFLDMEGVSPEAILAVGQGHHGSEIAPMSHVGRDSIRENLFSAGELLRLQQIVPDEEYLRQNREKDLQGEFIGV